MSSCLFFAVFCFAVVVASGQRLYNEPCKLDSKGHGKDSSRNVSANSNTTATDRRCDSTKHLECVRGKCVCAPDHVYDGSCGCKYALAGHGAPCSRVSGLVVETCDSSKHLFCDQVLGLCRCKRNFFNDGSDSCIPGRRVYGDSCHIPVHPKPNRSRNATDDNPHPKNDSKPERPYRYHVRKVYTGFAPLLRHYRIGERNIEPAAASNETVQSRKVQSYVYEPKPKLSGRLVPGPGNTTRLVLEPSGTFTVEFSRMANKALLMFRNTTEVFEKCDPKTYFPASAPTSSQNETEAKLFKQQEAGDRCDPARNLQCIQNKCRCINELTYGMYRRDKEDKSSCKKASFYACFKSEDCLSRNCVSERSTVHQKNGTKVCLPKGTTARTYEKSGTGKLKPGVPFHVSMLSLCHLLRKYLHA